MVVMAVEAEAVAAVAAVAAAADVNPDNAQHGQLLLVPWPPSHWHKAQQ